MEAEVVLPGVERLRGDERRDSLDGRGLPGDDDGRSPEPRGLEERVPVQARRLAGEVRARPLVVGVLVEGRFLARRVRLREGRLEREHRLGAPIRVVEPGEREETRDGFPIAAAPLHGGGLPAQVEVAVPECEAALHEEGAVARLAVGAVLDGESQDRRRGVDAEVERIHVGAHRLAQKASEREPVADAIDPLESRP